MKILSFTVLLIILAPTAQAQKAWERKAAKDEALTYANSLAFMHMQTRENSSQDHAFVFFTGDSFGLEPSMQQKRQWSDEIIWVRFKAHEKVAGHQLFGTRAFSLPARSYVMMVPRQGGEAGRIKDGIEFDTETFVFNFEAGKCYSMDSRVDENNRIEFQILETAETEAAYKEYMDENPCLDGIWSAEKRANTVKYTMQYTIDGERTVFEGTSRKKPLKAEGRVLYNENTMVFIPESARANGKQLDDYDTRPPFVWYYTLADGVLKLEGRKNQGGISMFISGLTVWENDGEFHKIQRIK